MIGKKPRAKKCDAILGIIAEGEEVIAEVEDRAVRDAGILAVAQAAEHYEIAAGTAPCVRAKALGHEDAELLQETLMRKSTPTRF